MVYSLSEMSRAQVRNVVRENSPQRKRLWLFVLGAWIGIALVLHHWNGFASAAQPQVTYVVHSGDTVWSVATHLSHGQDPRSAVDEILSMNHLDGNSTLVPGEVLKIPPGL